MADSSLFSSLTLLFLAYMMTPPINAGIDPIMRMTGTVIQKPKLNISIEFTFLLNLFLGMAKE